MIDYAEKRDYQRMVIDCDVELHDVILGTRKIVKLADLSATGMLLLTDSALPEGGKYRVTVTPGCEITPPLEADIVVLRCDEQEERCHVAAAIKSIVDTHYPAQLAS